MQFLKGSIEWRIIIILFFFLSRDPWGRRCTEVVAIDALVIRSYKTQFGSRNVMRELNKVIVFLFDNDIKKTVIRVLLKLFS